ncbi:hypothetical protein DSO57_1020446 [Entomophthora muscae]|uniref:Uncharacterized protein n=2 Tax=Entomophthora muscae TaxID=34485 RepID=A0ACC2SGN8_9FUNG|nr:hypothetical protein DSO57_1020445 [Entomophthora muscae]KAJ9061460.1 hypothetical protein DSO57_1020446 [Entomophthora muscae]
MKSTFFSIVLLALTSAAPTNPPAADKPQANNNPGNEAAVVSGLVFDEEDIPYDEFMKTSKTASTNPPSIDKPQSNTSSVN